MVISGVAIEMVDHERSSRGFMSQCSDPPSHRATTPMARMIASAYGVVENKAVNQHASVLRGKWMVPAVEIRSAAGTGLGPSAFLRTEPTRPFRETRSRHEGPSASVADLFDRASVVRMKFAPIALVGRSIGLASVAAAITNMSHSAIFGFTRAHAGDSTARKRSG